MNFKTRNVIKPELSMAPLIDVVLLLLIFFMISSSFVIQPGLRIQLPRSLSTDLQPENQLKIIITKDNRLILGNRSVQLEHLRDTLVQQLSEKNMQFLLIKADEMVRHGMIVQIMDIARSLQLDVGIATRPSTPETSN
ncbi:biopolymer transporter ExbD [bacterium]|nr:biopolymer transporter ExbD [bacterium]